MYVKLWDDQGQMWEVTQDRVAELVIVRGWTQTPPDQTPETVWGVPYNTAFRERTQRAKQKD